MTCSQLHRLAIVLLLAQGLALAAESSTKERPEEKKPGFFGRVTRGVTGLFTKGKNDDEKKTEAPAKTEEKPAPKKTTEAPPKPKMKSTSSKSDDDKPKAPKPKATPKPKSEEPAKETPKPSKTETAKKEEPAPKTAEKKPAPEPAKAPAKADDKPAVATTPSSKADDKKPAMKGDGGEFDDVSSAFGAGPRPEPTKPGAKPDSSSMAGILEEKLPPPPPLPSSDGSWEIVKLGHDYVTFDSIQRFYRFSTLKRDGSNVWLRSPTIIMRAQIGSQDLMINNIKFVLSYPVAESRGKALVSRLDLCKLLDPVLLPSHISTAEPFDTVVIDAGHGGHDSGAKGVYGYEKDYTLQMAFSVRDALQKRGFKTVLTRSTDEFITLGGRVAIANATPKSIFVSLHFNSSNASASGIETWALSPAGSSSTFMGSRGWDNTAFKGNTRDSENIALATAVHGMVIHRFQLVDRGIKRARWSVLTGCLRPGILFEGGFVTNGTECRLIASPTYREAIANSIGDAVVNYRRALQPRVVQPKVK